MTLWTKRKSCGICLAREINHEISQVCFISVICGQIKFSVDEQKRKIIPLVPNTLRVWRMRKKVSRQQRDEVVNNLKKDMILILIIMYGPFFVTFSFQQSTLFILRLRISMSTPRSTLPLIANVQKRHPLSQTLSGTLRLLTWSLILMGLFIQIMRRLLVMNFMITFIAMFG